MGMFLSPVTEVVFLFKIMFIVPVEAGCIYASKADLMPS